MDDTTDTWSDATSDMPGRYRRARHLIRGMPPARTVAFNTTVCPVWIGHGNLFWYVRYSRQGKEFRLVDSDAATNELAFDHRALAGALAEASRQEVDAEDLPVHDVKIHMKPLSVDFTAFDKRWRYEPAKGICAETVVLRRGEARSPDGAYVAYSREHNIWVRDLRTGQERALTDDGEELYSYGAASTGWGITNGAEELQVRWSPDSKRLFIAQRDKRRVKVLPVVHHVPEEGIRPTLKEYRVAYPGDEGIEEVRLLSIEVDTGVIVEAAHGQIPTTRNGYGFFTCGLGWWGVDSRLAYFVDVDRWYKYARVVEFDTVNGACRVLFTETSNTHVNLMLSQDAYPSYLPLPETSEILWYSERTGYAHFYLYDLTTGELKHPVTRGPGLARNIVRYVPERREVFLQMAGRVEGRDPYYRDLVRVNIDTGEMRTLAWSDHEYVVVSRSGEWTTLCLQALAGASALSNGVSPTGEFAVVTRSRADEVPLSYLVDRDGKKRMDLETADVSGLPHGWQWPEPVTLTAADGQTKIHGLVFRPSNFDPDKSWPVLSHGFNQPEISWVSKGSFTNGLTAGIAYLDAAALAELGFIVVQIDGRGSPEREKAFLDESYGWMEHASHIDDHAAGIRQLADRYRYMDLDRVGISAAASGGSGCVQGLLKHPDLFKVGVTAAYHDSRLIPTQMSADKYEGRSPAREDHHYPEEYIGELEGKLLIMIGMLDTTTPPAATFRLVEALQKANKDFDLVVLPRQGHEPSFYSTRRAWDYFVRHLLEVEPPGNFNLATSD